MTSSESEARVLGPGWPGWWLRVLVGASAAGVVAVLAGQGVAVPVLVLFGLLGVVCVRFPGSAAATLLVAAAVLLTVLLGGDPVRFGVLALVPLLHLLHVSSALAGVLPARSRVHPAALVAPARRFVLVQLAVFALPGVVAWVPAGPTAPLVEAAALVGVAALALVALRLTSGRRDR
jgi:hypothetical protein